MHTLIPGGAPPQLEQPAPSRHRPTLTPVARSPGQPSGPRQVRAGPADSPRPGWQCACHGSRARLSGSPGHGSLEGGSCALPSATPASKHCLEPGPTVRETAANTPTNLKTHSSLHAWTLRMFSSVKLGKGHSFLHHF